MLTPTPPTIQTTDATTTSMIDKSLSQLSISKKKTGRESAMAALVNEGGG